LENRGSKGGSPKAGFEPDNTDLQDEEAWHRAALQVFGLCIGARQVAASGAGRSSDRGPSIGARTVIILLPGFDKELNVKSLLQNVLSLSTNVVSPLIMLLVFATATVSIPACAQDLWQIDPKHSVATLSLGSGASQLQVGLARVSGEVEFEPSDPGDPIVTLKIVGDAREADYASMSFISKRPAIRADGKLTVTGELSVTRAERCVTAEPNEAYAGPQYGEPVTRTTVRQITFVFSDPRQFSSLNGAMQFSGSSGTH
jgi:hypothetical protein